MVSWRYSLKITKKFWLFVIFVTLFWILIFIKKDREKKIDWNDYRQLAHDALTIGFGEHGESAEIYEPDLLKYNDELFKEFGMSVIVSDIISVNRTIPDYRFKECLDKRYPKYLPAVSVVIIFNDEVFSVFKRTLHSLYNRTPHQLIKEVILVNDNSTFRYVYENLPNYVKEHFPDFTFNIIHLKERSGLVKARIAGARAATADYLFIMEPHLEFGYNWLPPLIEPVVQHPKTVVVPIIDFIEYTRLKFGANFPSRGIFDWDLEYRQMPRLPHSESEETIPYQIPLMTGGIYLIRKEYFFELGPYDEGLEIWGAEHLELSFKLHLCGGNLIEVPCSRIAHMYRSQTKSRKSNKMKDFLSYNRKRVIEVWMDDYKNYVYDRRPNIYNKIDPGDLNKPLALKQKLNCKPFKHFIEHVAPDIIDFYTPVMYKFANGSVRMMNTEHCLDTFGRPIDSPIGIYKCNEEITHTQYFELTWYRDIRLFQPDICLDASGLQVTPCHYQLGNQLFKYDLSSHQIISVKLNKCMEANLEKMTLSFSNCNKSNNNQKWQWSNLNVTALMNWDKFGRKIL